MACKVLYKKGPFNNIQSVELVRKSVVKDLEVYFDKVLSFNYHITEIVNRLLKVLGFIIRNIWDFSDIADIKSIYDSLSILTYCDVIWNSIYDIYVDLIKIVQKKFARYLYFKLFSI